MLEVIASPTPHQVVRYRFGHMGCAVLVDAEVAAVGCHDHGVVGEGLRETYGALLEYVPTLH